ncbi:MAG: hypothetical protein U0835_27530, partial [Isosphaeraceae bacterium]
MPPNLPLDTAGVVWITDFGVAKADDGLTQTCDILDTIRYTPPLRFRGEADVRAPGRILRGFWALRTAATEPALAAGKRAADCERALRYAEEALRARPDDPETHCALGTLLFRLGRDEARA